MNKPETKKPAPPSRTAETPEDIRFRYIGFEIHSKRIPKFWQSEEEARRHAEKISLGAGMAMDVRDFSQLHTIPVSKIDKAVITAVAVTMIATLMMPWIAFRNISGVDVSLGWGAAFGQLTGHLGNAFAGGFGLGLSAIAGLILLVCPALLGLWILASVWMKAKTGVEYLMRLRLPLKLGYLLFFTGAVLILLAFLGGDAPGYSSWGLIDPGEGYGIGALFTVLSYGPYAAMAMGLVAGVKSGDL